MYPLEPRDTVVLCRCPVPRYKHGEAHAYPTMKRSSCLRLGRAGQAQSGSGRVSLGTKCNVSLAWFTESSSATIVGLPRQNTIRLILL